MEKKLLKISKNILILAPALLVIVLLIIPEIAGADPFTRVASEVARVVRSVALALGIVGICVAAIMFITAGGDEKRVAIAKAALIYGLIGLVLAGGAEAIRGWAEGLI